MSPRPPCSEAEKNSAEQAATEIMIEINTAGVKQRRTTGRQQGTRSHPTCHKQTQSRAPSSACRACPPHTHTAQPLASRHAHRPMVARFLKSHPVTFLATVLAGCPPGPCLCCKRLCIVPRVLCPAPSYLPRKALLVPMSDPRGGRGMRALFCWNNICGEALYPKSSLPCIAAWAAAEGEGTPIDCHTVGAGAFWASIWTLDL
mmetsp:Transcript_28714/g.71132  ORF Transcript_28714/g.71132 Transcript_28714/m.71132 type:complete len:203 (-) Transcript_28714:505-1113(-)